MHEIFMQRCIQLAQLAAGNVAPNPMVGAVLVHDDKIIGEGFHEVYGGPHAEVNCINSVSDNDQSLISQSTMYVSLEPCAHFGKTPPCADLLVSRKIPKVVIGCRDPFFQVDGKGIEKLQAAGIQVSVGVLEDECKQLNKRFFTFHEQHRPFIILKWAQTQNAKIGGVQHEPRLLISNEFTNRLVHKWRNEESGILVGTTTALLDDPILTNRYWPGKSPIRLVVDMELKLPSSLKIFTDGKAYTIVFNARHHEVDPQKIQSRAAGVGFYQVTKDVNLVQQISHALYQLNIQSVLVEGGPKLTQQFIDEQLWDEARVITNPGLHVPAGVSAPVLNHFVEINHEFIMSDHIEYFENYSRQQRLMKS